MRLRKTGKKRTTTTEANEKSLCQKASKYSKSYMDEQKNRTSFALIRLFACLLARSLARSRFSPLHWSQVSKNHITRYYFRLSGITFPFFRCSRFLSHHHLHFILSEICLTSDSLLWKLPFPRTISLAHFVPTFLSESNWNEYRVVSIETAANFKGHFNQQASFWYGSFFSNVNVCVCVSVSLPLSFYLALSLLFCMCFIFSDISQHQTFYDPCLLIPSFTLHFMRMCLCVCVLYFKCVNLDSIHHMVWWWWYTYLNLCVFDWDASIHANNQFMLTIRTISAQFKISQYNSYGCACACIFRTEISNAFGEANHHRKIHFFSSSSSIFTFYFSFSNIYFFNIYTTQKYYVQ